MVDEVNMYTMLDSFVKREDLGVNCDKEAVWGLCLQI